jgi:exonuclease 3'-5' domain-containing protein 1
MEDALRGNILEAFAHWVRHKTKELDTMICSARCGQSNLSARLKFCKSQLEQASQGSARLRAEITAEFIFSMTVTLLGQDAACLANLLSGQLSASTQQDCICLSEWPATLLANMVEELMNLQAKLSKLVMDLYHTSGFRGIEETKNSLMMFFTRFTVDTNTGTLETHESNYDAAYCNSDFRVNLIDSYGTLLRLLFHLEFVCYGSDNGEVTLAVDFEGVKLCRHGALCLVQMTCSDDPTLVYVLDVHVLGEQAFTLRTPSDTSMKSLLESQDIRKVWFDPRNDADALYHQFHILPRGIFDLQLAEVADRRHRGFHVARLQGLQKCLTQCTHLRPEQKVFAQKINDLGKSLFEPQHGGNYEIFLQRPLNPVILVYAAHDSRYMLLLFEQYWHALTPQWVQRVLGAGDQRARWCLNTTYVNPSSDAPEF